MAFLLLGKILEGAPGVRKDGTAYIIAEEVDANAYFSLGQEVLQLQRLSRIEVGADLLKLTTHKSEIFFFPPDQLVGFKFGAPDKANRASAGFR